MNMTNETLRPIELGDHHLDACSPSVQRGLLALIELCDEHTWRGNSFRATEFPRRRDAYALGDAVRSIGATDIRWVSEDGEVIDAVVNYERGLFTLGPVE